MCSSGIGCTVHKAHDIKAVTVSLGPVQEFVGISFTRDNLNCFRVN